MIYVTDKETKTGGWVDLNKDLEQYEDHTIDVELDCGYKAEFFLTGLTPEEYLKRTIYFKQNNL